MDAGITITCQNSTDPLVTAYAAGVSATSADGKMVVTIMSADPAPPAQDLDAFTVKITDGSGNPLSNLPITVTPFMPQMGHGVGTTPVVAAQSGGVYDVSDVYLFMPGIWQLTFQGGPGGDSAAINFCIVNGG